MMTVMDDKTNTIQSTVSAEELVQILLHKTHLKGQY
jgi:hypothetical protein